MPWGAIIGSFTDLGSGFINSGAAGSAAKEIEGGFGQANQFLTNQYNTDQGFITPYATTGGQANNLLSLMMSNPQAFEQQFTASPGYQYNLQQQQGAINNSAAAKGGLTGGNTLMALQSNASGLANQDYQQYIANLMQQQGLGFSAAGTQAQLGQQYGDEFANNLINSAKAGAAGKIGQAQAWSQALSGIGQNLGGMFGGGGGGGGMGMFSMLGGLI